MSVTLSLSFILFAVPLTSGSTECVWATGKLICNRDQKGVLNATVALFDLDGPAKVKPFYDHIDRDDKMGVTVVHNESGIFNVEGCANDFDWIPGVYIRIHHFCTSTRGSFLRVMPTFKVFVPQTYDYHMYFPIYLD